MTIFYIQLCIFFMVAMHRRGFLRTAVVPLSAVVTGCGGFSSAKVSVSDLESPESVSVGDTYSASVTITNNGGTEVMLTASLESSDGTIREDIDTTIPANDAKEFSTENVSPTEAGETQIVLRKETVEPTDAIEDGTILAETTVSVTPKEVSPGTGVTFGNNLLVTVDGVTVTQSVFSTGRWGISSVTTSPTEKVFVIYDITVENVGTESVTWGPGLVSVPDGEMYGDTAPYIPNSGERLNTKRQISAADSVSGYLIALLPTDVAATKTPLVGQRTNSGATPEFRWPFAVESERSFPEFVLKKVDTPRTVTAGQQYDITCTIENTGAGDGTLRALLQYESTNDWKALDSATTYAFERTVKAGNETTISTTNTFPSGILHDDEYKYRLAPFSETWITGTKS